MENILFLCNANALQICKEIVTGLKSVPDNFDDFKYVIKLTHLVEFVLKMEREIILKTLLYLGGVSNKIWACSNGFSFFSFFFFFRLHEYVNRSIYNEKIW